MMVQAKGAGFGLLATGLAFVSAISAFTLLNTIWPASVAEYKTFDVTPNLITRGDVVTINSYYHKYRDCGGIAFITLTPQDPGAPFVVLNQTLLGTRPPGEFSVSRQFRIPPNAPTGINMIQETLNYECGTLHQTVRSPARIVTVLE